MADKQEDYFDRQRRIEGWNQELLSQQVVLCLGVGTIGTSISMEVCRLGVKKLYLLDMDVVSASNLNRQILFTKSDIGKKKVAAAVDSLKQHNLVTEIVGLDKDALAYWPEIVKLAEECDVIFNCIDIGDYFDAAVQSLAIAKNKPYFAGGSHSMGCVVDAHLPNKGACFVCDNHELDKEILKKLAICNIEKLPDLNFIKSDVHPTAESSVFLALTVVQLLLSQWIKLLMNLLDGEVPTRVIMNVCACEIFKWPVEKDADCLLCSEKARKGELA